MIQKKEYAELYKKYRNNKAEFLKQATRKNRVSVITAQKAFSRLTKEHRKADLAMKLARLSKITKITKDTEKMTHSDEVREPREEPNSQKMLHIMQLKESGIQITEQLLQRLFFSPKEIEWLKKNKDIEIDTDKSETDT